MLLPGICFEFLYFFKEMNKNLREIVTEKDNIGAISEDGCRFNREEQIICSYN
jgi:hypothetical protein